MQRITKKKYHSWRIGKLAKGCRQCVCGNKLVLYITGLCPRKCFYCPLSEKRAGKDLIWANEMPINSVNEAVKEAKLCSSKGAGITGGDPLVRLGRTCRYIKALKKEFGKKFHIHLYTSLVLVNEQKLKKLFDAGLDEIRFHPDLINDILWGRLELAKKFEWDIGVEIPVIPNLKKQTKKLIDFISDKINFLNLNELEISDTNINKLVEEGFTAKDNFSYAVKGSDKLAKELLKYCKRYNFDVHYCTCKLKDKVQLGGRLKRRAKNIAKDYDIILEDGTLVKGVVYLKGLEPGFDYEKRLKSKNELNRLIKIKNRIQKDFDIPSELIEVDKDKQRIVLASWILDEIKHEITDKNLKKAIVQEYPTWDKMIVELDYL